MNALNKSSSNIKGTPLSIATPKTSSGNLAAPWLANQKIGPLMGTAQLGNIPTAGGQQRVLPQVVATPQAIPTTAPISFGGGPEAVTSAPLTPANIAAATGMPVSAAPAVMDATNNTKGGGSPTQSVAQKATNAVNTATAPLQNVTAPMGNALSEAGGVANTLFSKMFGGNTIGMAQGGYVNGPLMTMNRLNRNGGMQ